MVGMLLLSPVAMLFLMVALDRWERRMHTELLESDAVRHPTG
jgi:hypothetical protein